MRKTKPPFLLTLVWFEQCDLLSIRPHLGDCIDLLYSLGNPAEIKYCVVHKVGISCSDMDEIQRRP